MFLLLGSFIFCSCAKRVTFVTSTVVPAAQGKVKVDKDDNGNYSVDINIKNLAKPERLQPKKEVYIVWMDTESAGVKNLGQLKSNTGFFSDALEGSLTTVTPYKPKQIFITAEDNTNISYPGSQVVLRTKDF